MDIGANGQPVYAAVLIFKAVEVGIVDSTRLVGGGMVHKAVLQGGSIVQGETAAGNNVRQPPHPSPSVTASPKGGSLSGGLPVMLL